MVIGESITDRMLHCLNKQMYDVIYIEQSKFKDTYTKNKVNEIWINLYRVAIHSGEIEDI